MTNLREAAQQALAFTMRDFASLRDFEAAKAVLHDNLRAALAQQAEALTVERLRDALVASRIIPPAAVEDPDGYDDGVTLFRIEALHRRIT